MEKEKKKKDKFDEFIEIKRTLPLFCNEFFNAHDARYQIGTKLAYAGDLRVFLSYLLNAFPDKFPYEKIEDITLQDIASLQSTDIDDYLLYLTEYEMDGKIYKNSEQGKKRKLMCLKALYKHFGHIGKIDRSPAEFVYIPKIKEKDIVVISQKEKDRIEDDIETGRRKTEQAQKYHDKTKYRDMAIYKLFLSTGIRVSELVNLDDADVDFAEQRVFVTRKGGKYEAVYFNKEALFALLDYMDIERNQLLGRSADQQEIRNEPLFISLHKRRISTRMVQIIIKNYTSGVMVGTKATPHTLRKTFGTELYGETGDLYLVQKALGHASVSTTQRHYAKFPDEKLKQIRDRK